MNTRLPDTTEALNATPERLRHEVLSLINDAEASSGTIKGVSIETSRARRLGRLTRLKIHDTESLPGADIEIDVERDWRGRVTSYSAKRSINVITLQVKFGTESPFAPGSPEESKYVREMFGPIAAEIERGRVPQGIDKLPDRTEKYPALIWYLSLQDEVTVDGAEMRYSRSMMPWRDEQPFVEGGFRYNSHLLLNSQTAVRLQAHAEPPTFSILASARAAITPMQTSSNPPLVVNF